MVRRRLAFAITLVPVMCIACNAILGVGDLSAPDLSDAAPSNDAPATETTDVVESGTDAAPDSDGGPPACATGVDADPCVVVEFQDGGSIFPTWPITSDLPIHGLNVTTKTPLLPSYEDAGAGAVRETHSGLTWRIAEAEGGAVTADEAAAACAALGTGWRLPTRIESATLQYRAFEISKDAGRPPSCIGSEFAAGTGVTWTSTSVPAGVGDPTDLLFESSEGTYCGYYGNVKTANYAARCVNGPTKPATFLVSRDSVTAVDTGLVWERKGVIVRTYAEAKAHCDARGARIPIIQELYGIIDTRTTSMFPSFFDSPGIARAIVSQTVFDFDPSTGAPFYEAVSFIQPRGAEDQAPLDDNVQDILVRCVSP